MTSRTLSSRTSTASKKTTTTTKKKSERTTVASKAGMRAKPRTVGSTSLRVPLRTIDRDLPLDEWPPAWLWSAYKHKSTLALRNAIAERYRPLVRINAERLAARLPQSIDVDDLQSAGVFGLLKAIDAFDLDRNVKFETYCSTRITGAMLDELRTFDWVPRQVRTRHTRYERALYGLEAELGHTPSDKEIAQRLGLSKAEYDDFVRDAFAVSITSLNRQSTNAEESERSRAKLDVIEDASFLNPLTQSERREQVRAATKQMSRKERLIMVLYYFENITMKDIGAVLGLSESRVCQIHTRVTTRHRQLAA